MKSENAHRGHSTQYMQQIVDLSIPWADTFI